MADTWPLASGEVVLEREMVEMGILREYDWFLPKLKQAFFSTRQTRHGLNPSFYNALV